MKRIKKLDCNVNNDPLFGLEYPSIGKIVDKINNNGDGK